MGVVHKPPPPPPCCPSPGRKSRAVELLCARQRQHMGTPQGCRRDLTASPTAEARACRRRLHDACSSSTAMRRVAGRNRGLVAAVTGGRGQGCRRNARNATPARLWWTLLGSMPALASSNGLKDFRIAPGSSSLQPARMRHSLGALAGWQLRLEARSWRWRARRKPDYEVPSSHFRVRAGVGPTVWRAEARGLGGAGGLPGVPPGQGRPVQRPGLASGRRVAGKKGAATASPAGAGGAGERGLRRGGHGCGGGDGVRRAPEPRGRAAAGAPLLRTPAAGYACWNSGRLLTCTSLHVLVRLARAASYGVSFGRGAAGCIAAGLGSAAVQSTQLQCARPDCAARPPAAALVAAPLHLGDRRPVRKRWVVCSGRQGQSVPGATAGGRAQGRWGWTCVALSLLAVHTHADMRGVLCV